VPTVALAGRVAQRGVARLGVREDAQRRPAGGIDERRGHFAKVHDLHGAAPHVAARRGDDAIDQAAVGLDESVHPLVRLGQVQPQLDGGAHPHPHAQHLARAQVLVARRARLEELAQRRH